MAQPHPTRRNATAISRPLGHPTEVRRKIAIPSKIDRKQNNKERVKKPRNYGLLHCRDDSIMRLDSLSVDFLCSILGGMKCLFKRRSLQFSFTQSIFSFDDLYISILQLSRVNTNITIWHRTEWLAINTCCRLETAYRCS